MTPSEKLEAIQILSSELLYNYPTLSATDLANAWVYADANPEEIDTAIHENDQDFENEDH